MQSRLLRFAAVAGCVAAPSGWSDPKLIACDIRSRFSPVVLPEGVAIFTQNADRSVGLFF